MKSMSLVCSRGARRGDPGNRQKSNLNVVTAGDQNMVDYVKDILAPQFEKTNPNASVRAVGTGPGDAGSQKIAEKLQAQKNERGLGRGRRRDPPEDGRRPRREGLLAPYRDVSTGRLVTSEPSKNALGTNVAGYVIPMFQSQTAIAWNPALVKTPPKSYDELAAWAKANPRKFGYNGIKGGMSGVAFVVGWVYGNTPDSEQADERPLRRLDQGESGRPLGKLKDFNRSVVITPGNAGTLDMLNRGEIAMGPVWVDMFYTWMADGKLPPNMRLQLIGPACPASRCTT